MNIIEMIQNLNSQKTVDLIIAILIIAALDILSPLFSYVIIKIFNVKKKTKDIRNNAFFTPLKVFFRVTGVYLAVVFLRPTFGFTDKLMEFVTKVYRIILVITVANSFANSITKRSKFIKRIEEKSDKDFNDASLKMMIKVIKTLIYIVAVFIVFLELDYDLSGLITGLGLGSVVLTLAAQDTLKNLLGGILIFMDKPFKVGDYIKILSYEGTVEDMTFRSTRIRTLDNSIVQIPNAVVSSDSIENISAISKRRYKLNLEVVLDTKLEKIELLRNEILGILHNNENVIQDTINVHFNEIGVNGLNIMIVFYFNTANYMEYLDLKEDFNEKLMALINRNKVELAYDTKTIEIKK